MIRYPEKQLADYNVLNLGSDIYSELKFKLPNLLAAGSAEFIGYKDVILEVDTGVLCEKETAKIIGKTGYLITKENYRNISKIQNIDENILIGSHVVAYNAGWRNYYHFLGQSAISIWLANKFFDGNCSYILPPINPKYLNFLKTMGIKQDRIIIRQKNEGVLVENAVIIDNTYEITPHPFINEFAAEYFENACIPNSRSKNNIYISRRDSKNRKLMNEDEIENYLINRGFKVFTLSGMNIRDQAAIFRNAKNIIAPHGAALTNLIFCESGANVIELTPVTYSSPCFINISRMKDLSHTMVVVHGNDVITGNRHQTKWTVKTNILKDILNNLNI